jgi:UDP-N-acetyl-2-amino-2-deoxyglucuronate dehydrogenase
VKPSGGDRQPQPVLGRAARLGVLGCGRISRNHFDAIQNTAGLELGGVSDTIFERAAAASAARGVPAYARYEMMLADPSIDAVVICTPSGLHPRHGVLAAKAGKHVISEKPMATRIEDADMLVNACDEAGVHLFVVKQNRLNPSVQMLKRAVDKGRFGRIYMANTTVRWSRPQEYYDQAKWRGTWEFDGGAFMNQASHYVDMIQWLIGPVETIMARTATLARRIEAEDSGAALLKFRSGALGVIEVTMLTYPKNLEGSMTILGEKGTVKIGGTAMNRVEHWEFAEYDDDDREVEALKLAPDPLSIYGSGHRPYYENVARALRGESPPGTDGRDGRKSLELILGIYESAKTGKEVPLPLRITR